MEHPSMTTPDYRAALASDAYTAFVQICKGNSDDAGTYLEDEEIVRRALKRLDELERALLAAPEAVGVADEELLKTYRAAKAADIQRQGGLTSSDLDGFVKQIDASELVGLRAVLSRYGTAHPAPVPVGERLPCAEDCDAEGRCWFHSAGRTWKDWYFLKASAVTDTETHWLPHWALPLPEAKP
jgi:hypothetical protein